MTHDDLLAELQVQADAHEALTAKYQMAIKALLGSTDTFFGLERWVPKAPPLPLRNGDGSKPKKNGGHAMTGAERRAAIMAVLGKSRDAKGFRVPLKGSVIAQRVGDKYGNVANSLSVLKAQGMVFHAARGTWGITKKGAKS